ncbi:hypothetical protein SKAU_G00317330 [Synaphobranchus kaupii]|uniref:Uncharacterized protein n=1 Tax=Synaphobranchus kaupii TaxID=118154 RepID=A0A9Q1ESY4_SYNKA|nr:hypothetical protein SKAU_G00317330 [Synaphobranchus kaupii]
MMHTSQRWRHHHHLGSTKADDMVRDSPVPNACLACCPLLSWNIARLPLLLFFSLREPSWVWLPSGPWSSTHRRSEHPWFPSSLTGQTPASSSVSETCLEVMANG